MISRQVTISSGEASIFVWADPHLCKLVDTSVIRSVHCTLERVQPRYHRFTGESLLDIAINRDIIAISNGDVNKKTIVRVHI